MKLKGWLAAMAGAMTLAWFAVPAQASPAGIGGALQAGTKPNAEVQFAHWRGRGYYYRPYRGGYYYGPRYRYRYYYGPRFYGPRFYGPRFYGPRYYRRHWGYRYW